MSQKTVQKWEGCKPGSMGSVLAQTLVRWQKKVPEEEAKKAVESFIHWTVEMQKKGMFGGCESCPPQLNEFDSFMKQAARCLEQTTAKLQEAGRMEKWRAGKAVQKAEMFLTDCQCFLDEVEFTIQSSTTVPIRKMSVDTVTPPEKQKPEQSEKMTPHVLTTQVEAHAAPAPRLYAEAQAMLEAIQYQIPQTQPHTHTQPDIINTTLCSPPNMGPVIHGPSIPFSLQDTSMIKSQLPGIKKGGGPWIKAFLEECDGVIPALGDFRRVFASCASLSMLKEVEEQCGTCDDKDSLPLQHRVHLLWPAIRQKFPIQLKSAELLRIPPNDGESGTAYLLRVRELWQTRIGEDPTDTDATELLFRGAVEASVSPTVLTSLKNVVGLSSMTYSVWAAHVTEYIDRELARAEQDRKEEANVQAQLAKFLLRDMRDQVNQAKVSAKQMPQQSLSPQDSQAPQQASPYPPQAADFQCKPIYCIRGHGKFRPGPKANDHCYQCGGYSHWAGPCQHTPYSQLYGTPLYEYNTYMSQLEEPPQLASPQEQYEGQWHSAPGTPQMPQ